MQLTVFEKKVYEKCKHIPKGRVSTYKELAKAAGYKGAQRAVGNAMHKNPFSPVVPCHRVVKSGGSIGGFGSGTKNKIKMLEKEGIEIKKGRIVNFSKVLIKNKDL